MAINQNWFRYEVDIGWKEVTAAQVFSDSIIIKLLEETITKDWLDSVMEPSYTNGNLQFNE